MSSPRPLLGSRIRELRRARGRTLRSISSEAGVHFTYLAKVETGIDHPSRGLVVRLDAILRAQGDLVAIYDALPCRRCGKRLTESMGAAWAAVEAALPTGWWFQGINSATDHSRWSAGASPPDGDRMVFGRGPTPAAALLVLAARLAEATR